MNSKAVPNSWKQRTAENKSPFHENETPKEKIITPFREILSAVCFSV